MNKQEKIFWDRQIVKRSAVPAVTHVDYTARIQTAHKNTNKRYYDLIKKFKKNWMPYTS